MNADYAVLAQRLCKSFPSNDKSPTLALDDISLKVPKGRLTALIGPDGAGKTTLLRLICGLQGPTDGTLEVLGTNMTTADRTATEGIQGRLSYMPQRFGLYEDLTVEENMELYAKLHGLPPDKRQARFDRLLSMTGLAPFTKRLAGKLSGGMKQKLGLACTLVRSPELLLLDEPTAGVDPLSRRELWEILQQLVAEEHLSVLVSTAYMDEAELCSKVLVLHQGKLLADATPQQLRQLAEGQCYSSNVPSKLPARILQAALLQDRENVLDAVPYGNQVRFMLRKNGALNKLQARQYFPGLQIASAPPRLEDAFMLLLREQQQGQEPGEIAALDFAAQRFDNNAVDIQVQSLIRKFGDFVAVNNTSFSVNKGEIFGLLGPNGAGKTTTFKMLCGLLPATSGQLTVAGVDVRANRTQARANLGYVSQKFSLYADMTVRENLEFYGTIYGLSHKQLQARITELEQQFGLQGLGSQTAGQLPGGYKQRLAMAAALLHQPQILFLDEPTSGIDPLARRAFWLKITALAAAGTTIIITTHFMEEAEYCDRIMIQDQGNMLALGTPAEIRSYSGKAAANMDEAFISIVEQARQEVQHE